MTPSPATTLIEKKNKKRPRRASPKGGLCKPCSSPSPPAPGVAATTGREGVARTSLAGAAVAGKGGAVESPPHPSPWSRTAGSRRQEGEGGGDRIRRPRVGSPGSGRHRRKEGGAVGGRRAAPRACSSPEGGEKALLDFGGRREGQEKVRRLGTREGERMGRLEFGWLYISIR